MSSFARSGRKLVETRRRESQKRLRGAAVSLLITEALENAELVQNPVRKGRSVQGVRTIENCSATVTSTSLVRLLVLLVESKTRTYHGRVGSERPAERPGGVGQDWVPTKLFAQETKVHNVPSKASQKRRLNVSPEARTSEILCKPTEEQNLRLTRGLSPVYHRFISGTRSALCSWLPTSGTTPFCLCKPFSYKACPGTCRVQNPDIPRAGRYGAAHGGTARPGGDGQHRTPTTGLFAQEITNTLIPRRGKNDFLGVFWKNEQWKPYVNRWRKKTAVDPRLITGLTAGRKALFLPGCQPVERRLFVFVNPYHARNVRE